MKRARILIAAGLAVGLLTSGAVVAGALQDVPQDARPAQDPIGDLIRSGQTAPAPTPAPTAPGAPPSAAPVEQAPAGAPAPASPVAVAPPPGPIVIQLPPVVEAPVETKAAPVAAKAVAPVAPDRRQRRKYAVVEAIDKITAERMRFEVEVGGRPVRFNKNLIFTARACEVSAPDELTEDAIAYLDVTLQPRATLRGAEPRQIFRGWMFASTPAVSGLESPLYDAWVVGCRA